MNDRLLTLIKDVVDEVNERRDEKIPTTALSSLTLYGDNGVFDSMQLVNFLTQVEEAVEDEYDEEISLTSEKAVSQRVSPFSRVSRLVAFVEAELAEAGVAMSEPV
jgi:acyl carrier protein